MKPVFVTEIFTCLFNLRIWTRYGTQSNKWRYAQITLISNQAFYVLFEGVRGTSYEGDIALDDLDIVDGSCPTSKECDFEGGLCGWKNVQGDQFDWRRDSGGTPSVQTGPSTDHTTGTRNGNEGVTVQSYFTKSYLSLGSHVGLLRVVEDLAK